MQDSAEDDDPLIDWLAGSLLEHNSLPRQGIAARFAFLQRVEWVAD
jgi:hypothetical protein